MFQTHEELIVHLKELAKTVRVGYADFSRKLNPTASEILGVPVPLLRKLIKEVSLNILTDNTLEEQILTAILVGRSGDARIVEEFVPKIHDWAVNDCLASECKFLAKDRNRYFDWVIGLNGGGEYDGRIALILLNDHFIVADYLDKVLQAAEQVSQDYFYTRMAAAWLVSTCMVKFPGETYKFLKKSTLPVWTHNKAIRKSCESFRVSLEDKQKLRGLIR
ncbi:MAG: DNA alkylation repair protein [Christensenellaceae bacterium]|jgi:3-methyladenine DNA glycosylase AlkD|nr:DNA alkylation repair protein [Christensenellaceae bacterium]